MVRPLGLPFDPIERAGETWEQRFGPASAMRAATSVFRVQQILLARFDEVLRPHELTFARYEVLVLLTFSRTGQLPLKVIGSRLMVHPTSVTNAIDRLVAAGYVERRPNPDDGRGRAGRHHRRAAGTSSRRPPRTLTGLDFGLGDLPEAELRDPVRGPQAGAPGRRRRRRDGAARIVGRTDSRTSYYLVMTDRTPGSGGSSGTTRHWPRARCATPTSRRCPASRSTRSTARPTSRAVPGFERIGYPGEFPFTRGPARHRLPRPGLDHPAVRRLRQRPADQRALQDDPGRGRRRAVGRLRHAHAHGPRLRRPARARRGRALRRRDRLRRRHGRALRRHPARRRRPRR